MDSNRFLINKQSIEKIDESLSNDQKENIKSTIERFEDLIQNDKSIKLTSDHSVYIGLSGYLYYSLHSYFSTNEKEKYLNLSSKYVKLLIPILEEKEKGFRDNVTFITGICGAFSLISIYFDVIKDHKKSDFYLEKIRNFMKEALITSASELFYGKSGYLYIMNFLNSYFQKDVFSSLEINKMCQIILKEGEEIAILKFKRNDIYVWTFMRHTIMGAAHGISGIIYQLLKCDCVLSDENAMIKLINTANLFLNYQDEDGNFLEFEDETDPLCHWCYGAPGVIPTLLKLYEITNDKKVLNLFIKIVSRIMHHRIQFHMELWFA
jgi:lantibiotic modifying enzyme